MGISPLYEHLSEEKNADASSRSFVEKSVQQAKWFINTLEMRKKTVYAAVCAIVEQQKLFFYKGPGHLRPLRIKDIAEAIGVHETSRIR